MGSRSFLLDPLRRMNAIEVAAAVTFPTFFSGQTQQRAAWDKRNASLNGRKLNFCRRETLLKLSFVRN